MNRFIIDEDDISISFPQEVETLNGGPGSGNFNPGQGRGVGKPSNKSKKLTYEEYAEKFKKLTRSEKEELDKEYPEYADRYFKELMERHIQRERDEKSFGTYEKDNSHPHFDLDKVPTELKYALDITPTQGLKKYDPKTQTLIDLKNRKEYYNEEKGIWVRVISMSPRDYSNTIIENNNGHYTSMREIEDRTSKGGIDMYVEKFKNRERQEVPYIKFNKEGKFSGEQEGFHRSFAADEIGDKEIPVLVVTDYYGKQPFLNHGRDITKDVENYYASKSNKNSLTRNQRLNKILNSNNENLDYRYDVKAYKEYLKEWLKHKDEPEYLRNGVLSFAEFWEHDIDYEFEDYKKILKLIDEYNKKKELVTNGGPGSGNFNPGQGRGVGKPADGYTSHGDTQYSAKNYLSKKEYEDIVNYSNRDNLTEEDFDAIAGYASSMGYGKSCELNQSIRENERTGEIEERKEIIYPTDDSQIVTWKESREFLENKIKEKEAYDKLQQEYNEFRQKHAGDANYRDEITKRVEEVNSAYRKLDYDDYSNYIENYKNGVYKNLKDDDKLWTIDSNKIKKLSAVELRKEQKNNPKEFYEKINIPRLTWSTYNPNPTTTDTMATVYGNEFKNLDKLDNVIKNKGYQLEKDITVTRRVANLGVIKDRIQKDGKYTQGGITSTTAAKSIGKKMPSGVHMGNDLVRITIPKGTRMISTWKPIEADIYKKAEKYSGGKLDSEDEKNLRMLKNQNELILPSGSTFVSPGGNKLIQNEDGSYQLILQSREEKTKNRIERLNFLQEIFNGVRRGNPYHDKFGKFSSADGASSPSSKLFYDAADYLGDESKSGDITKDIKSFKDFKDMIDTVKEDYNGGEIEGQEIWIHPESKLFKKLESPVTDKNVVKQRKTEIENENKSPFILVSRYGGKDVIVDGNHVAASYRELSDEGKNYYVPILYVQKKEYERFEKDNPNYHEKEKVYTVTKKIDEK